MIIMKSSVAQSSVLKMFTFTLKCIAEVFEFLQFEECVLKRFHSFYDRLVLTVGLSIEIKLHFQIYPV